MRRAVAYVAVALVVGATSACSSGGLRAGEARLDPSGPVEVSSVGHRPVLVHGPRTLHRGDQVAVLPGGSAIIDLVAAGRFELRSGSRLELDDPPELLAGDLLVEVARAPLTVDAAGTRVAVGTGQLPGAAHLFRAAGSLLAASYQGGADLSSLGRTLAIPALRQATLPAPGLVPTRPIPLDYHDADAWDRRFLGDAIALGETLVARGRSITNNLSPDQGLTPSFYRQVVPALTDPTFDSLFIAPPARPILETIVGVMIDVNGHQQRGSFSDRWSEIFGFRDEGAAWGLVALDQQVDRLPLLQTADRALALAQLPITQPATEVALGPAPTPPPSNPGPPSGPSPTQSQPRPSTPPRTSPPTTSPLPVPTLVPLPTPVPVPSTVPPPPKTGSGGDSVVGGLVAALNGVLGSVASPKP